MAEIKGLTIKKIVNFKGHEGEPLQQGDIYLNGKKVGYYSDDSWGGTATIDFDSKESEKEVGDICKAYFTEHPEERWCYGTDFAKGNIEADEIFTVLLSLINLEKEYKKMLKKGYSIFAVYKHPNGYQVNMMGFKTLEYAKQAIEKKEDALNPKFYTSLADFIIR